MIILHIIGNCPQATSEVQADRIPDYSSGGHTAFKPLDLQVEASTIQTNDPAYLSALVLGADRAILCSCNRLYNLEATYSAPTPEP